MDKIENNTEEDDGSLSFLKNKVYEINTKQ